jgi:hypothetical protein
LARYQYLHAGGLDIMDMHKNIGAAAIGRDEAISTIRVEEFNPPTRHAHYPIRISWLLAYADDVGATSRSLHSLHAIPGARDCQPSSPSLQAWRNWLEISPGWSARRRKNRIAVRWRAG